MCYNIFCVTWELHCILHCLILLHVMTIILWVKTEHLPNYEYNFAVQNICLVSSIWTVPLPHNASVYVR